MDNDRFIFTKSNTKLIKGITIILMLWHHLFAYNSIDSYISMTPFLLNGHTVEQIIGLFGKICVTTYFFLSGYGIACVQFKVGIFKLSDALRKIKGLYINYWIVFMIFIPIGIWLGKVRVNIVELLMNFIGISSTLNYEWWFFRIYVVLILLAPFIFKFKNIKKLHLYSLLIIISAYLLRMIIRSFAIIQNVENTEYFFNIYFFMLGQYPFVLGYIFKKKEIFEKIYNALKNIKKVFIFMAAIGIILIKFYVSAGMLGDTILTPIYIILCVIIFNGKITSKVLCYIGENSTNMWLVHTFYSKYYFENFIYAPKYSVIILLILLVLSLITSVIIRYVLKYAVYRKTYFSNKNQVSNQVTHH